MLTDVDLLLLLLLLLYYYYYIIIIIIIIHDILFNTLRRQYRRADKSLTRPTSGCILFKGENISFDASLVINEYI